MSSGGRHSLSARLDNLIESSRTPSPDPDMLRASSALRPLAVTPKLLYPQPAIDALPPSPSGSSHRGSPPRPDMSLPPSEDVESRQLQERTARALQEAMATDVTQPSRHGVHSRSASVQRPGPAKMPPTMMGLSMRTPPLLDLARQTTLANASLTHLPPLPSDPASDTLEYTPATSSTPTLIQQSAPTRTTSIDTLRTIQSRGFHSSASSEVRSSSTPGWWFTHKQDVEPLLEERDQDDGVETAEDKLRKRCEYTCCIRIYSWKRRGLMFPMSSNL